MKIAQKLNLGGLAAALALVVSAAPTLTRADDLTTSFTAIVTSNYLFRGATQSLHEPSVQASFDVASGPFYGGIFAGSMDFDTEANLEIDIYAGYKPKWGAAQMDFAILGYFYPQQDEFNLFEAKAASTFANEAGAAVTVSYFYSPEWGEGGPISNYLEVAGAVPIPGAKLGPFALTANASFGRQVFGTGAPVDYNNWKLSISGAAEKGWYGELAWTDTDLELEGYKGVVSVTLKKTF
jgi:uncharacterized protein (TIGR02001 family)